ncbi:DUF3344 domain-containing protein [Streptomyces sp. NPDC008159]|uniref:DUF3344 domain-containing protein n=1 Tax=Streptomyces sp. NPDC008159 TaxID=3364817 RepID=UPI0036E9AE5A
MRHNPGLLLRRVLVCCCALAPLLTPGAPATATSTAPSTEAASLPFQQRYHVVRHGGIVRAANSSITCRTAPLSADAPSCLGAREGRAATNGDFDMFYIDVDSDPNTYNSSRGEVRLPRGARVMYARLYWGGNLRVGEQKPPRSNKRVLIAEPGGAYKEVLADTVVGHRVARGADAYQASADVTKLVRSSGPGLYTVAQVNVAMGRSAAGAWGGWTLVVAYEDESEPLRHLAVWDGFTTLAPDRDQVVTLPRMTFPAGADGWVGLVAYNGDRGTRGDALDLSVDHGQPIPLSDAANPPDDILNSTISEPGPTSPDRSPAHANTLGYDSDVLDVSEQVRHGGDRLVFRMASQRDSAWVGVLFVALDATP